MACISEQVDQLFAAWDRPDSPGCALAVMQGGEIVYKRGYGMANLEYDIPITPTTIFHVASVSKQFTAFAVALLAAEGKVSLDDEVCRYEAEYAGSYFSPELDVTCFVCSQEGQLGLQRRKYGTMPLTPTTLDGFSIIGVADMVFERDEQKRVTGFKVSTQSDRSVRFVRRDACG
jgi:hypothetical protein